MDPIPHPIRFRTRNAKTDSAPEPIPHPTFFPFFSGAESDRVRNQLGAESDTLRVRNRTFMFKKMDQVEHEKPNLTPPLETFFLIFFS